MGQLATVHRIEFTLVCLHGVDGEHVKAQLSAYPRQGSGQEVGTSHPEFERAEGRKLGLEPYDCLSAPAHGRTGDLRRQAKRHLPRMIPHCPLKLLAVAGQRGRTSAPTARRPRS